MEAMRLVSCQVDYRAHSLMEADFVSVMIITEGILMKEWVTEHQPCLDIGPTYIYRRRALDFSHFFHFHLSPMLDRAGGVIVSGASALTEVHGNYTSGEFSHATRLQY